MTDDRRKYNVGYGRPPKDTQFRKGQSGNPRGRPKGSRNKIAEERMLSEVIRKEANRRVPVNDGVRPGTVTMTEAVVRSINVSAARGGVGSQRLAVQMMAMVEEREDALHREFLEAVIDYKVEATRAVRECREAGLEPPEMYPHPDDIKINFETGDVLISGPMTKEDAEARDAAFADIREGYEWAVHKAKTAENAEIREILREIVQKHEEHFPHIVLAPDH